MKKPKHITAITKDGKIKFKCVVCNEESQEYPMPESVDGINYMATHFGSSHSKCKDKLGFLKR